jgi:hypothetical protein
MYAGTKKWGTVRILVKRCTLLTLFISIIVFTELYKYKDTKRKDQHSFEVQQCSDASQEFDIIVKASTPRRKISTIVEKIIKLIIFRLKHKVHMLSRRI